ncbi:MAG TPA: hypothetical protein VJK02_04625 [Anaerolineales bacterium]|nr:hypothetical protein [Anaerolineales bacterium]
MSDSSAAVDRPRAGWILWVGVLALIGIILILAITRFGPGASGDSAYYVMGAQNMIEGNGFSRTSGGGETKPITGFPPVFSAVLAVLGLAGGDLLQVGRFLNAGLFAVNIFLAGGLVHRYTRSLWPTLLACAALLAADNLVGWHAWVMSEPLYVSLMLVGILGITSYFEEDHFLILVGTGLSLAAATLTRYVGVAQLLAFALSILFLSERNWLRRFYECVLLSMVSLIPVFLWLRWNVAVAGTGVNRDVLYHPMRPELIGGFLSAASAWFVPGSLGLPLFLRVGIPLLVASTIPAIFVIRSLRRRLAANGEGWREKNVLPWILLIYIGSYVGILVVNSTFLDASTTLSAPSRYLLPVFVAAVILFTCIIFRLLQDGRAGQKARWGVGLLGLALIGLHVPATVNLARDPIPQIGYTGLRYTLPAVVNRLEQVGPGKAIISNNPELVFILVGKPAYMRPIQFDAYQLAYREDFEKQVADAQSKLDLGAVLVLFGALDEEEMNVLDALNVVAAYVSSEATFYVSANTNHG